MTLDVQAAAGRGTDVPRLQLTDVGKTFGSVAVLRDVQLTISPGEVHGLVGQNGAGKSTLTRILAGGYPDYRGTVAIDGDVVRLSSPREATHRGVSVIYQEFSLVPQMTVAENLMLGVEAGRSRYSSRSTRALAASLLDDVGMSDDVPVDVVVGTLSAAIRQRVEIAKALTRKAGVIILDEPTARLAGPDRAHLFELMKRTAAGGTSLIFISHILDEVLQETDRITVLRDGSVVESGSSSDFDAPTLSEAILGRALSVTESSEHAAVSKSRGRPRLEAADVSSGHQVKSASLTLHAGEIVGIAGLVGSGRSTLARALTGAAALSDGMLTLDGKAMRFRNPRDAIRAGVVIVPEDRRSQGLVGQLSIAENLTLTLLTRSGRSAQFVSARGLRTAAREAVSEFEIQPARPDRLAATFSGGNQQKVLLARAVLSKPEVLVVDQPTAGVDVGTKAEIHRILHRLADGGAAVLVISDDVDEIVSLSDRLIVMRHGVFVAERDRDVERTELINLMATGGE